MSTDNQTNSPLNFDLNLDTSDFTQAIDNADRVAKGFASSLSNAFVGVAVKGKSLGDVISAIGLRLSALAVSMAFKPLEQGFESLFKPLTEGLFTGTQSAAPAVTPFAKGGVVSAPTFFPMSGGLGVAGERGAEAIMPLTRGSDGSLGVRVDGGAAPNVTVNIATPDIDGFRRSQSEIAASLARAVARGRRGL